MHLRHWQQRYSDAGHWKPAMVAVQGVFDTEWHGRRRAIA